MKIESIYMNDTHGVEVTEVFETEIEILRKTWDGDIATETVVSVDFFNTPRKEHPENNRTFTWEGIENQTDVEIMETLFNLVPELKK